MSAPSAARSDPLKGRRVEMHSPYGFFRREATQIPNGTRGTIVEGRSFEPFKVDWDGYGVIEIPTHWVGPVVD